MHNVHEDAPVLLQSRWALSYLRGPMTLPQIRRLSSAPAPAAAPVPAQAPAQAPVANTASASRPVLPAGTAEYFLHPAVTPLGAASVAYRPSILAKSKLHFVDAKSDVDTWVPYTHVAPFSADGSDVEWEKSAVLNTAQHPVSSAPLAGASFMPLPAIASRDTSYKDWGNMLKSHLYQNITLDLYSCPAIKVVSRPGETEGDFRARLELAHRERRDDTVENLRRKYAPKLAALEERLRRARQRVDAEKSQVKQQTFQTAVSVGATILGALLGRRVTSVGNMGRAATAARGMGRTVREQQDVGRAEENVAAVQEQLTALQAEFTAETTALQQGSAGTSESTEKVHIRPTKGDIAINEVALVWILAAAK